MTKGDKRATSSDSGIDSHIRVVEVVRGLRRRLLSVLRLGWSILKRIGPRARMRRKLANQYLRGDGIEIGALHNPLPTFARVRYVDRLSRKDLRRHYPELAAFPVVDPDIVDDGERLTKIADGSLDFIIANHFIEHCEDPIGTLKTFAAKLRPGGTIYLAVPDKRHTFDRARPSTTIEHLQRDNTDGGRASRWGHYLEFAQLAATSRVLSQDAAELLAGKQMAERYSIHFHVWNFEEFGCFLEQMTGSGLSTLSLSHRVANGDEGIFILRRH